MDSSETPTPATPPPVPPHRPRPVYTPPPRRPGRGWMFLSLFLLAILLFMMIPRALKNAMGGGHVSGRHIRAFEEVVFENNGSENKVAVIDVYGMIASQFFDSQRSMVTSIADQLRAAQRDRNVKAVILRVNSPGGEVLASDEIYRSIDDFQKESGKPVIASMASLAASGGYYVSAPCRWIVANELTITGSIGVIMQGYNYRGLMDKVGVRPETYKSGPLKNMMGGGRKESEIPAEEHALVQSMIMETYGRFTNIVATGRNEAAKLNKGKGQALKSEWVNYVDGRVFSGKQALDLGFVDELGNFETAVKRALNLAGVAEANLIQYQEPFNIGDIFRLSSESKPAQATVKLDLGFEFPRLQAGYLYFLSPTVLP